MRGYTRIYMSGVVTFHSSSVVQQNGQHEFFSNNDAVLVPCSTGASTRDSFIHSSRSGTPWCMEF